MNRVSKILSLPIVEITGGKNMGIASTIVYDFKEKKLYLTLNNQKQGVTSILATDDLVGVGEDYVLIMEADSIVELTDNQEVEEIVNRSFFILEKDVVNTLGTRIGKITDIVLNEDSDAIETIILDGNQQEISGDRILSVTDRLVFVKDEQFKKAPAIEVSEKDTHQITEPEEAEEQEEDFLDEEYEEKESAKAAAPKTLEKLTLTTDVVSEDGKFKAPKGTVITKKLMQEAEKHNALIMLAMHAK